MQTSTSQDGDDHQAMINKSVVSSGVLPSPNPNLRAEIVGFEQEEPLTNKGIKTMPMSPFAASSTVVNLILATGPFNYPYGYVSLGPVISAPLLFITSILAYITATYLVEALSVAVAIKNKEEEDDELNAPTERK